MCQGSRCAAARAAREKQLTFNGPYMGHKGPHISDWEPVYKALAPDKCVLINDAVHPTMPHHVHGTWSPWHAEPVAVVPDISARVKPAQVIL